MFTFLVTSLLLNNFSERTSDSVNKALVVHCGLKDRDNNSKFKVPSDTHFEAFRVCVCRVDVCNVYNKVLVPHRAQSTIRWITVSPKENHHHQQSFAFYICRYIPTIPHEIIVCVAKKDLLHPKHLLLGWDTNTRAENSTYSTQRMLYKENKNLQSCPGYTRMNPPFTTFIYWIVHKCYQWPTLVNKCFFHSSQAEGRIQPNNTNVSSLILQINVHKPLAKKSLSMYHTKSKKRSMVVRMFHTHSVGTTTLLPCITWWHYMTYCQYYWTKMKA